MRKIVDVKFRLPGQTTNLDDKQWAEIILSFNAEDDHHREVGVTLLASNAPTASLLELHRASRGDAIATLKAALSALEQHELSELAEQAAANAQKDEQRRQQQIRDDVAKQFPMPFKSP